MDSRGEEGLRGEVVYGVQHPDSLMRFGIVGLFELFLVLKSMMTISRISYRKRFPESIQRFHLDTSFKPSQMFFSLFIRASE